MTEKDKIMRVLTLIKLTCADNDCDTCPFSDRGNCIVPSGGSIPEEWDLNKLSRKLQGGK